MGEPYQCAIGLTKNRTSTYVFNFKKSYIILFYRYFITYHQWNSKPEFVFATHHVVSYEDVVNQLSKERQPSGNSIGKKNA